MGLFGISVAGAAAATPVQGEQDKQGPMMALGYLSRLLPNDYVFCPPPMKLAEDIYKYVTDRIERAEVQLAGVSVAASGWNKEPATPDGRRPGRRVPAIEALVRLTTERAPLGQMVLLYPCGCSAVANRYPSGLPMYCAEHGRADQPTNVHIIHGERTV